MIYERVPDAVMGRVTTINSALCWSLMPFGGLLGGVLSETIGVTAALLVVGFAYLAATMAAARDPGLPEFDKPQGTARTRTEQVSHAGLATVLTSGLDQRVPTCPGLA